MKLFLLFTQDLINLRSDIIKKHKIMICKDKQIVEDAIKSLNRVDIQNIDVVSSLCHKKMKFNSRIVFNFNLDIECLSHNLESRNRSSINNIFN